MSSDCSLKKRDHYTISKFNRLLFTYKHSSRHIHQGIRGYQTVVIRSSPALDTQETMRFVLARQASTIELPFTLFDVLSECADQCLYVKHIRFH